MLLIVAPPLMGFFCMQHPAPVVMGATFHARLPIFTSERTATKVYFETHPCITSPHCPLLYLVQGTG